MTPETLKSLQHLPLFPANAKELIRIAGMEAAARLIASWPGQEFPVPAVVGGGNDRGAKRWDRLVKVAGEPAAQRIVQHWPGQPLYIPSCKEAMWSQTQDKIRAHYDQLTAKEGYSHPDAIFELGITYNVAGRRVEMMLTRPDNAAAVQEEARFEAQLSLFELP